MNDIRILLYTQDPTPIEFDVSYIDEIPISFNFLISDIRNPDKKNASFSKTITFPGTKEINRFFELIWKSNVALNYFNPNKKCDIYYYVNGVLQFKGYLQLIKINVDDSSGEVVYECSCKGTIGNVFTKIGDALLSDLNFNRFGHLFIKANVKDSWATQIQEYGVPVPFALGNGYVYPLVNNGATAYLNLPTESNFWLSGFKPALYKKTILDQIFSEAGYTYTSTFFNSTFYKSQIVYSTNSNQKKTQYQLSQNQFYAGLTTTLSTPVLNTALIPLTYQRLYPNTNPTNYQTILFNDTSTAPYNDAGSHYSSATGFFTKSSFDNYKAGATLVLDVVITASDPLAYYATIASFDLDIIIDGAPPAIQTYSIASFVNQVLVGTTPNLQITVINPVTAVGPGGPLFVQFALKNINYILYKIDGTTIITGGTSTVTANIKAGSEFYANYVNQNIQEGDIINLDETLPINIKQIDWLMSEFKLHNLYMVQDKDNEYNYFIEDRENFYSGSIDWSDKRDYSMKREVLPIGELDFLRYELAYIEDADYYNNKYQNDYLETFGKHIEYVDNDFINQTKDVSVIYSGTPLVGNDVNGLVIPYILNNDNGVISTIGANIRSLYYGGLIPLSFGSWTLHWGISAGSETYTTYPFAGDCDNPYNPTLTINWDTPHEVYYTYQQATYTDNNLYNRFYSRMINQLTDKDSKIERRYYNLSAYDIKNFDFRNVIWDDGYYLVNAIKDYNFMKPQSTMVELLKLTDYAAFDPDNDIDNPLSNRMGNINQLQNLSSASGTNINFGNNSNIVGGDNNFIASGSNNVTLTNSNDVVVDLSISNFTGLNLNNASTLINGGINLADAITIKDVNGFNLAKVNASQIVNKSGELTVDTTIDGTYSFYYVNATSGNITITIDPSLFNNYEFTFIRTDSSVNTITLAGVASETLNGAALPQLILASQYDVIKIKSDNINLFII